MKVVTGICSTCQAEVFIENNLCENHNFYSYQEPCKGSRQTPEVVFDDDYDYSDLDFIDDDWELETE